MPFGEIVIGAPGAGKSTYAYGKYQLFAALERPIAIVNLDPANESLPYPCAISISSLITLQDAMNEFGLGPNGAMLYCMEYLEANFDWLLEELSKLHDETWVVFDLPGQVELSTNHDSLKNIITRLTKSDFRVSFWAFLPSVDSETFRSSLRLICVTPIMSQMLRNTFRSCCSHYGRCFNSNYRTLTSCQRLICYPSLETWVRLLHICHGAFTNGRHQTLIWIITPRCKTSHIWSLPSLKEPNLPP